MIFADIEDGCHIFVDANILVYHFSRKSRFNTHKQVAPSVVCSGYSIDRPTQEILDAGADGFI